MNLKKIFCWTPLLSGVGAAIPIGILVFMTYQTELGLWLLASFGSTLLVLLIYIDCSKSYPLILLSYEF